MELAESVIAVVQIAEKVLHACTSYMFAVRGAWEDIERLRAKVQDLSNDLTILKKSIRRNGEMGPWTTKMIAGTLLECSLDLEDLGRQMKPGKLQSVMKKFGKAVLKWPFSSTDVDKIVATLERHKLTINLAVNIDVRQNQQLTKLPYARDAAFNSALWQHQPSCLPGTRVELLQQIHEWSNSANGAKIYWLCGMAGTGKSTISRTLAKQWYEQKRLGASFFFSRGQAEFSNGRNLFNTIAFHLSNTLPALRTHINKAITENPDICHRGLSEQWKHLIFRPLSKLKGMKHHQILTRPLVILIDGLDDWDNEKGVQTVVKLLGQLQDPIKAIRIRVFLTSRPKPAIRSCFDKLVKELNQDFVLHDIAVAQHDISLILHHEFGNIRRNRELPDDWPGHDSIERITQRANGSFIYAVTVCRFIGNSKDDPRKNLSLVLGIEVEQRSAVTRILDAMYIKILQQTIFGQSDAKEAEGVSTAFRRNVGAIILLFDPLSTKALAALLHRDQCELDDVAQALGSVTSSDRHSIPLLHPSFRDFLIDPDRCTDTRLWIDENRTHNDIFLSCLNVVSTQLKKDICELQWPGVLRTEINNTMVKDSLPAAVQYACSHWVHHLEQCKDEFSNNSSHVLVFFKKHFLHWLEALSLMGRVPDGILALNTLESVMETRADEENNMELHLFLRHAKRFLRRNRAMLETAPLQIYCSALIFSPRECKIKKQYSDEETLSMHLRTMIRPEEQDPLIQVYDNHTDEVTAITYSPDGKLLASASKDKTVRLWDPSIGACQDTLEGHTDTVRAVTFSPDGKVIASASGDRTIRLWDSSTGECQHTLEGHTWSVTVVAFSPDGKHIASASNDSTVRLWNPSTGVCQHTFKGLISDFRWYSIAAVTFSLEGELLAFELRDKTVLLRDPSTGACRLRLGGHDSDVIAVTFSPDGKVIASASMDNTIRLWNSTTYACQHILRGHASFVTAVAFSPDGKVLASASKDETVRLWNTSTGACQLNLGGHTSTVTAVMFSPDGRFLASSSRDNTVRLWDLSRATSQHTYEGHTSTVTAVSFSSDGKRIASASHDGTVRLWDPSTGAYQHTLEGHTSAITAVAFSPDGKLLASASGDNTVKLWDSSSGACQYTLWGHTSFTISVARSNAVAFSPDGKLIASTSADKNVRLWDPSTGLCEHQLAGHTSTVIAIAFSPDGMLLASASFDTTIRLWDSITGACRHTLGGHTATVNAVTFSLEGKLLASASGDRTVRLWYSSTGECQHTLEGHTRILTGVAFSQDGKLLASASDDNTIRLWDIRRAKEVQQFHTDRAAHHLSFSSHCAYLETDRGNFKIDEINLDHSTPPGSAEYHEPLPISIHGDWIQWRNINFLLLPVDLRPTIDLTFASILRTWHNILAIGHASGRVTILALDISSVERILQESNIPIRK